MVWSSGFNFALGVILSLAMRGQVRMTGQQMTG